MTSVYYSEQARNDAFAQNLNTAHQWQAQQYVPPLSFLANVHLPNEVGALTTPPAGPYSTSVDVSSNAREGDYMQQMRRGKMSTTTKVAAVVAVLAAFYFFLPQRA